MLSNSFVVSIARVESKLTKLQWQLHHTTLFNPQPLFSSKQAYLSQDELLRLDSCWASSRIFSMSPLWIEDDEGTCSRPPTIASSSSTWGRGSRPAAGPVVEVDWTDPDAPLFISNSTQDPAPDQKKKSWTKLFSGNNFVVITNKKSKPYNCHTQKHVHCSLMFVNFDDTTQSNFTPTQF